tara:strand:+ start:4658 stop:5803 length:1146 start_codon:yes stop_codon:yes gene_type:complete
MKKHVSIFGSTGSIGISALKIADSFPDIIKIESLTANSSFELLIEQTKKHNPRSICIVQEEFYKDLKAGVNSKQVEILVGRQGLIELSRREDVDIMLNGLVGAAGMEPTLYAIESGVNVALANKESLVMAGGIINKAMKSSGAKLFPVDSEHSAIWQCLAGESLNEVRRIILTGSGGPFRKRELETFIDITVEEALNHPNWDMGKKISIDSATMMNKCLEVIEAYWLFNLDPKNIDIIIHPQSVIHSMVEFKDGSIKAQMGVPDMKVPIQYALTFPSHLNSQWESLDFLSCGDLTFRAPDFKRFPSLKLAYSVLNTGGTASAALNLSNDYAVKKFLEGKIKFTEIYRINCSSVRNHPWVVEPNLNDLTDLDSWVKKHVNDF